MNNRKSLARPEIHTFAVKKLYIACLCHMSLPETIRVWDQAFQSCGMSCRSLKESLAFIWEAQGMVVWELLARVSNSLERHAALQGREPVAFFAENVFTPDGAVLLPPIELLRRIDSLLAILVSANPQEVLLDKCEEITKLVSPQTTHRILKKVTGNDLIRFFFGLMYPCNHHPSLDIQLTNSFQQSMAAAGHLPPFEEVEVLAERRSVTATAEVYGSLVDPAELEAAVRPIRFGEMLDEYGIEGANLGRQEQALRADRDVYTRDGRLRVLKKGRLYGAPIGLTRVSVRRSLRGRIKYKNVIDAAFAGPSPQLRLAAQRHEELMASLRDTYQFMFRRGTGTVLVNGRKLASGVPAKVIASVAKAYAAEGRKEFPNAFFQANEEIVRSKLDKSLNVHLKRAIQHLQRKAPLVSLERKTGSGVAELSAACEVRYEEE